MHTQTFTRLAAAGVVLAGTSAFAQNVCSQSVDNMTLNNGSVACTTQMPQNHVDNGYLRRYSPLTQCMSPNGMRIGAVNYGIETAVAGPNGNGMQAANIRLYTIAPNDMLLFANMTMVHDEAFMVPDSTQTLYTQPLSNTVLIPPGSDVVVEFFTPSGIPNGDILFIGSNTLGQTAPSYLAAMGCGANDPTDTATLGFPNMHIILDLVEATGIGTNYCSPAVANSTGMPATMEVSGSDIVADNNLTLIGNDLPNGSFAIFLTGQSQGLIMNPGGSQGNICISSPIGRYVGPGQIQQSVNGSISLTLDLTQTPTPNGLVPINAGETWNFQAWYRDAIGGMATSNFTDGIQVDFL